MRNGVVAVVACGKKRGDLLHRPFEDFAQEGGIVEQDLLHRVRVHLTMICGVCHLDYRLDGLLHAMYSGPGLVDASLQLAHAGQPSVGVGNARGVVAADLRVREDEEASVAQSVHRDVRDLLRLDRVVP